MPVIAVEAFEENAPARAGEAGRVLIGDAGYSSPIVRHSENPAVVNRRGA
jgi:hypothetical protein